MDCNSCWYLNYMYRSLLISSDTCYTFIYSQYIYMYICINSYYYHCHYLCIFVILKDHIITYFFIVNSFFIIIIIVIVILLSYDQFIVISPCVGVYTWSQVSALPRWAIMGIQPPERGFHAMGWWLIMVNNG